MFSLPESQLYPLLQKLTSQGWIEGEWQTPTAGPARKTYSLTDAGRAELTKRREHWTKFTAAVGALLMGRETVRG